MFQEGSSSEDLVNEEPVLEEEIVSPAIEVTKEKNRETSFEKSKEILENLDKEAKELSRESGAPSSLKKAWLASTIFAASLIAGCASEDPQIKEERRKADIAHLQRQQSEDLRIAQENQKRTLELQAENTKKQFENTRKQSEFQKGNQINITRGLAIQESGLHQHAELQQESIEAQLIPLVWTKEANAIARNVGCHVVGDGGEFVFTKVNLFNRRIIWQVQVEGKDLCQIEGAIAEHSEINYVLSVMNEVAKIKHPALSSLEENFLPLSDESKQELANLRLNKEFLKGELENSKDYKALSQNRRELFQIKNRMTSLLMGMTSVKTSVFEKDQMQEELESLRKRKEELEITLPEAIQKKLNETTEKELKLGEREKNSQTIESERERYVREDFPREMAAYGFSVTESEAGYHIDLGDRSILITKEKLMQRSRLLRGGFAQLRILDATDKRPLQTKKERMKLVIINTLNQIR